MELAERAYGVNVFSLHVDAVAGRLLADLGGVVELRGSVGKGIVYARRDTRVSKSDAWLERGARDVPWPGTAVAAGHPVCTVLSHGSDRESCLRGLYSEAAAVYGDSGRSEEVHRGRATHHERRLLA
jgi:predicted ATP-grasp superfamily ATP-dependent carboligase